MTIKLAIANGSDIKVHAADCADLKKVATKRAAYNGIDVQSFPNGTTERDVWIDFNIDFLEEALEMSDESDIDASSNAWPMEFLPCCHKAGLVANPDRSYTADHK